MTYSFQVLVELLGTPVDAESWLGVNFDVVSGNRKIEEHYWSQLTKNEIRRLHEKYSIDHELFGFSPDYYVAMGQDEE